MTTTEGTASSPQQATPDQLAAEIARLQAELRHQRYTIRALQMIAGRREDERARHRSEVGMFEQRVDELRRTVADILATFTDRDRPDCGSPRARSWWVDARRIAVWRSRLVEPEPDQQTGAAA